jgi:hypothetical protein
VALSVSWSAKNYSGITEPQPDYWRLTCANAILESVIYVRVTLPVTQWSGDEFSIEFSKIATGRHMITFLNIVLLIIGTTATLAALGGTTWVDGEKPLIQRINKRG